jgi:ATP diphosphatase
LNHVAQQIERLLGIMAKLRDPEGGCPWDLEQSFETIAPYTIEEAYEVADAIERRDMAALKDELGDLLFQVVYHARMAEEDGEFTFPDVAKAISDKMIRRHPHVFGEVSIADADAQTKAWEVQKAEERSNAGNASVLAGVARGLPALLRAYKLQARAARVGFDWPDAQGALDKLHEELGELAAEMDAGETAEPSDALAEELGDVLFSAVNLARKLGIEPEDALRRGNRKFERRFGHIERRLAEDGRAPEETSLEEMEALWQEAKAEAAR